MPAPLLHIRQLPTTVAAGQRSGRSFHLPPPANHPRPLEEGVRVPYALSAIVSSSFLAGGRSMALPWDEVMEFTKAAQGTGCDPSGWAVQVASALTAHGVALPSPELALLLASHLCWENDVPLAWKYVEKALAANIAPPMLLVALLSVRYLMHQSSVLQQKRVRIGISCLLESTSFHLI